MAMQQQMQQAPPVQKDGSDEKDGKGTLIEYLKNIYNMKDALIIVVLSILINLEPVDDLLKFKNVSFFYDIETDKSTFVFFLLKSLIIGVMFYLLQYFTK